MKKLLLIFLILLAAIGLGFLIHDDPGYAMISYHSWMVATSAWVALALFFIAFFVFYFLVRLIKNIFALPDFFSHRRKFNRAINYEKNMSSGIIELALGNFKQAEKCFLKTTDENDSAASYLLLAQTAHMQGHFEERDAYLQKEADDKEAEFAVYLTQAQFYLHSHQTDDALLIFKNLYKKDCENVMVLNGLKTIYLDSQNYEAMKLIVPQLKKRKLISEEELKRIKPL